MAGCDYGKPLGANAPRWLVRLGTFPRWPDDVAGPGAGSPAWVDQVLYRDLPIERTTSMPVHPTELYEALASLAIAVALLQLRTRRAFRGQLFLVFVGAYAVARFFLEMLRDDPERGALGPLSTSQWIAIASVVAGALLFRRLFLGRIGFTRGAGS
jgi:phosphatidylglycerol:prolipoprotein diacylglycerol transferase